MARRLPVLLTMLAIAGWPALALAPTAAADDPDVCRDTTSGRVCAGGDHGSGTCDTNYAYQNYHATRVAFEGDAGRAYAGGQSHCWTFASDRDYSTEGESHGIDAQVRTDEAFLVVGWSEREWVDNSGREGSSCRLHYLLWARGSYAMGGEWCWAGPPPRLPWGQFLP